MGLDGDDPCTMCEQRSSDCPVTRPDVEDELARSYRGLLDESSSPDFSQSVESPPGRLRPGHDAPCMSWGQPLSTVRRHRQRVSAATTVGGHMQIPFNASADASLGIEVE